MNGSTRCLYSRDKISFNGKQLSLAPIDDVVRLLNSNQTRQKQGTIGRNSDIIFIYINFTQTQSSRNFNCVFELDTYALVTDCTETYSLMISFSFTLLAFRLSFIIALYYIITWFLPSLKNTYEVADAWYAELAGTNNQCCRLHSFLKKNFPRHIYVFRALKDILFDTRKAIVVKTENNQELKFKKNFKSIFAS